jgi:NNP family nitrate/nitrite transporter-like MFS transporter
VLAGFLFKAESLSYQQGLLYLDLVLASVSVVAFSVRFSPETLEREDLALKEALMQRDIAGSAAN